SGSDVVVDHRSALRQHPQRTALSGGGPEGKRAQRRREEVKIDNGTGGSRETSTGKPARVDERGRESINLFAELKRRNVYKVGIAYAIVGWLLVQVATQVFPFFEIP